MQQQSEVQQGWEFAAALMGADIGANMGNDYVTAVELAIKQLEDAVNNHEYRNLAIKQLQGYMQEEWAAGTFNVDAVAGRSAYHADVLHSTAKDSVDILLRQHGKDVAEYSAKSYANGAKSAVAQAQFNRETGQAGYYGQGRLVPADQLGDAQAEAHRQALRNAPIRPEVSDAYAETERNLTDRLSASDGTQSRLVSRDELDQIARESKDQSFKAEDHGVTTQSAIQPEYLLNEALKAGYSAAVVSVALQLAPEIYKSIDYLIKNGELDIEQVQHIGVKGISAGVEGFLRGSIAASLRIVCDAGMLGNAFKDIDPTVLGTVVALVLQTAKNGILVASGAMSAQQMGSAFVDSVLISGGYIIGAKIGGVIGQTLGFTMPVFGYMLGSLIGTSVSVVYNIGKHQMISFCVDTGFTCFGLVDQDYEIPNEVLEIIGIETIPVHRTQVETSDVAYTEVARTSINTISYETIDITVLRRGIIGVNKIGYVLA